MAKNICPGCGMVGVNHLHNCQKEILKAIVNRRETKTVALLVSALSNHLAADASKTVDLLTGYLWDADEANQIKAAL